MLDKLLSLEEVREVVFSLGRDNARGPMAFPGPSSLNVGILLV